MRMDNSRFKFRAWDKETVQMRYPSKDMQLLEIDYHVLTLDVANVAGCSTEESDYIVMQYTGLKDKNGKEIFEGDIVLYERYILAPNDYHSGEPLYPEGIYVRRGHVTITTSMGVTLNGIQEFNPDDLGEEKETRKYNQNPNCWGDYAEVIGNIYENPELLEAEK